jgi:hypothetical protein
MTQNKTTERPQSQPVRSDTVRPASTPQLDRHATTSREDLRRDTQRPRRASASAGNVFRFGAS